MNRLAVLLPLVFDRTFTYAAAAPLPPGTIVVVPFGPRRMVGVVWDEPAEELPPGRTKPVEGPLDLPPIAEPLRRLIDWVASYTLSPRGLVLRIALRGLDLEEPEPERMGLMWSGSAPARATAARQRLLAAIAAGEILPKRELLERAGVSAGVADGLLAEGVLQRAPLPPPPPAPRPDPDHAPPRLEPAQAEAAAALTAKVAGGGFSVTLLQGVTGSGKTEVYGEAVAAALRGGRQALVLLPEIALTTGFLERFERRFGARPHGWHAGVPARTRVKVRREVASGEAPLVVGARSALFLPFRDLGLIVVDEEHDSAYKQEDPPVYHARDMAVVRGRTEDAPVVLVSATPSLETRVNAERGRYDRLDLPTRFGGRSLPDVAIADLTRAPPPKGRFLGPQLVEAVGETIGRGEQALLFLNRRGFAPLTLCRRCGHRLPCPNCSAWLVEHRFRGALICHHCGHNEPVPSRCPHCGAEESLVAVGPGVERIRDEAKALFPEARLSVLSSDLAPSVEALKAELEAIAAGEVDIVVGTSLIAKGHTFPHLTLVGVVDADIGLGTADPRAAERTFQQLEQVTGRAGRGERPGRAVIQTYDPRHPVVRALAAGDAEAFYSAETEAREAAALPPFGRLASLVISGPDRARAESHARALAQHFPPASGVRLLGPSEAPLAVLRGRHRQRLLVKAPRGFDLSSHLRRWLAAAPEPRRGVTVAVDVDPQSFL